MVGFGFFDDWHPQPGRLIAWAPTAQSRAAVLAAPEHPVGPSYQQREYLRAAYRQRGSGSRASRLCMIAFDFPSALDRDAMTRTITAFARRHDTFWSWFSCEPGERIARHVADPGDIEFEPRDYGEITDSDAVRDHVQRHARDVFDWDCFGFGVIDRGDSFTVYAAVDHLHTDGVGQALSCVDLLLLYGNELSGGQVPIEPVDGHLAYCERELSYNAELTTDSAPVQRWLELLIRHDGAVPSFPMDLGVAPGASGFTRGAQITVPLFEEAEALRFEQVCQDFGGKFLGGVFAAIALTEHELTGRDKYFVFTPVNTRSTPGEQGAIGWYTSLVPVAVAVRPDETFTSLVGRAQAQADAAKELAQVCVHRVLELAADDPRIHTRLGFSAPMVSYVDVRRMAGAEMFDRINGGLYGNRASSSEVYLWINRFPDITQLSMVFPDTPRAHEAVAQYLSTLTKLCRDIALTGTERVDAALL
ncbi:condensation domain-containing protein [Nocardia cerradoensis]|uniref:condensation domain-containing protein n=1 Tax=Nocardia cerradoensis TaxID=85688 RepID=UPI000315988F|nr:condensation domain-containing protein [Nocardia cerradoensis]NKY48565.1 acyltransferase [Nocardia cerradoensis]